MKTYLFLSDIHANYEALLKLRDLPEFDDPNCTFIFLGDYTDGFNLKPNAQIHTWLLIKQLCDMGKAKAILGNHDDGMLDFLVGRDEYWLNYGGTNTLENLGIPSYPLYQAKELLKERYGEVIDWLKSLPFYLELGTSILGVHAGFALHRPLVDQNKDDMLWLRGDYYDHDFHEYNHEDYKDKVIVSGHTPTEYIEGKKPLQEDLDCPILLDQGYTLTRYYIDGGSKGSLTDSGHINLLKLDENGNFLSVSELY